MSRHFFLLFFCFGVMVVVGVTVSEGSPQAEAHKSKQTKTENFFIPTSLV